MNVSSVSRLSAPVKQFYDRLSVLSSFIQFLLRIYDQLFSSDKRIDREYFSYAPTPPSNMCLGARKNTKKQNKGHHHSSKYLRDTLSVGTRAVEEYLIILISIHNSQNRFFGNELRAREPVIKTSAFYDFFD